MESNAKTLISEAKRGVGRAETLQALDELWRVYFGSKGGRIREFTEAIKNAPVAQKADLGRTLTEMRRALAELFAQKREGLEQRDMKEKLAQERIDVTRPGTKYARGSLHPLTRARRAISDIFLRLGFSVIEGPEVETERYNFDALNIPAEHPARDMWDTFWLKNERGMLKVEGRKGKTRHA